MKTAQRAFGFEMKALDSKGVFSGYGSVFDVIDSYREVVTPGAFSKSLAKWKAKDRLPPMLYQHRAGEPIGAFTEMHEDKKGLYVEGQLLVDDIQRAKEVYALLKAKALSGMSIGFNVMPDGEEYDSRAGIYKLTELELWEVSIVTFPANEAANVESVKAREAYAEFIERIRASTSRGQLPTVRDFEESMREVFGFSKQRATAIASLSIGSLRRDADSKDATQAELIASVTQALAAATAELSIADSLRG
jgi:HK97 family phage prohead protease